MFGGSETTHITSPASEDQVYAKVQEGLKDLGTVKVSKSGAITVDPAPSLTSFHSATTVSGTVTKEGGDYVVKVDYDCSPTPVNWIITLVLGLCIIPGGGLAFFLITLFLGKPAAQKAVQSALDSVKSKIK